METCKYCKKEFKKEDIDRHEFNCVSSYGNDNILENMIPCEICRELVEFDKYNDHISIDKFYINYEPIYQLYYSLLNVYLWDRSYIENVRGLLDKIKI